MKDVHQVSGYLHEGVRKDLAGNHRDIRRLWTPVRTNQARFISPQEEKIDNEFVDSLHAK